MITPRPELSPSSGRHLHIAVVDDVAELRQLVQLWLEKEGHAVTCAADGREAIRLVRRQHFDLIITDIIMPESDGLDVIKEVRQTTPNSRVLAMSGGGHHLMAGDCLRLAKNLGANALLRKPFNLMQLLDGVARATTELSVDGPR